MVTKGVGSMASAGVFDPEGGESGFDASRFKVTGTPINNVDPNTQSVFVGPQTQQTSTLRFNPFTGEFQ